jgi:hypothetical protein
VFTASVTVTDSLGRSASSSALVTVNAVPPPTLAATVGCRPGTTSTKTFCNVAITYGGVPLDSAGTTGVVWDWGDGSNDPAVNSPLGSHQYAQSGTYLVAVLAKATPNATAGLLTATASTSVIVPP